MANQCRTEKLCDLVFSERGESELTPILNALLEMTSETPEVNSDFVLDAIAVRWITEDILKGQGVPVQQVDNDPLAEVRVGE